MSDSISMNRERTRRLREKLARELGDMICDYLSRPETIEIMLNTDGALWVERVGHSMERIGSMAPHQAGALIATVASAFKTTITRENPILECELPIDGSRFEALIPPVVAAPVFAIRRRPEHVFTLADYVEKGIMTGWQRAVIAQAVEKRSNILIAGGTGSGKTTLVNAVIEHIARSCPADRLVIIEDTAEIQCSAANSVILRATVDVNMNRLVRATMRLRPDRVLIGEVRGAEALELIKAWNTGHPGGVATIHANSADAALARLESLIHEATAAPVSNMIVEAIDLVVFITKDTNAHAGRRVQELARIRGVSPDGDYMVAAIAAPTEPTGGNRHALSNN